MASSFPPSGEDHKNGQSWSLPTKNLFLVNITIIVTFADLSTTLQSPTTSFTSSLRWSSVWHQRQSCGRTKTISKTETKTKTNTNSKTEKTTESEWQLFWNLYDKDKNIRGSPIFDLNNKNRHKLKNKCQTKKEHRVISHLTSQTTSNTDINTNTKTISNTNKMTKEEPQTQKQRQIPNKEKAPCDLSYDITSTKTKTQTQRQKAATSTSEYFFSPEIWSLWSSGSNERPKQQFTARSLQGHFDFDQTQRWNLDKLAREAQSLPPKREEIGDCLIWYFQPL